MLSVEYLPEPQSEQAATAEVWPVSSFSFPFPAGQVIHAIVEEEEYLPAAQAVQVEPPGLTSVSVTDPAAHVMHSLSEAAAN